MVNANIKIKIVDPNKRKTLEDALENMIAYQLASEKVEELKSNT